MSQDHRQQLQQLRAEFADGLVGRLLRIEQLLQDSRGVLDVEALFREVHSLSGSAGSFGFGALGKTAQRLEQRINEVLAGGGSITPVQRRAILDDLAEMQRLAAAGAEGAMNDPAVATVAPASAKAVHERSLIYLVEDDPGLGDSLQTQLQHLGYRVELFAGRQAAEAALARQLPDALVVDVVLPEGHLAGTELVKDLTRADFPQVPVMFVSSRGDWEARLAAVRAHGDAYLTKPLDMNVFFNQIDILLKNRDEEPYRILLVDDMPELVEYYARVLGDAGMQVKTLTRPDDILHALASFQPELVLLDLHMPDVSGTEVAQVIRQNPDLFSVPIIFLSAEQDRDLQLLAMRQGDDFLQKPVDEDYLASIVALKAARARELGSLMYRDSLTGLLNHGTLKYRLTDALHRMRRDGKPISVVMLDIDHFKRVNDGYGHPVGDRVLRQLARLLRERLRVADMVGRYGGEEFCLVLSDSSAGATIAVVDKLRTHFSGLVHSAGGDDFQCTFSAGVAEAVPADTVDSVIGRADEALYRAKRAGRNRVENAQ